MTDWFNMAISVAVEVTAIAVLVQYWITSVNSAVWIAIGLVFIYCFNLLPVRFYGETEVATACIKVITLIGYVYWPSSAYTNTTADADLQAHDLRPGHHPRRRTRSPPERLRVLAQPRCDQRVSARRRQSGTVLGIFLVSLFKRQLADCQHPHVVSLCVWWYGSDCARRCGGEESISADPKERKAFRLPPALLLRRWLSNDRVDVSPSSSYRALLWLDKRHLS